jgi:hypothetical protein
MVNLLDPCMSDLHTGSQDKRSFKSRLQRGPQENHMAISTASRRDHTEGQVARTIEQQTAKLPSDTFLWAAIASMVASASLHMMGNREHSVFVGQWAPTFLILGLYNKLVKQLGSDFTEGRA